MSPEKKKRGLSAFLSPEQEKKKNRGTAAFVGSEEPLLPNKAEPTNKLSQYSYFYLSTHVLLSSNKNYD